MESSLLDQLHNNVRYFGGGGEKGKKSYSRVQKYILE